METIILVIVIVLVILLLLRGEISPVGLIINGLIGVVLIFLTNIVLATGIPINLITILISAIGGVVGWLLILILHFLGIAF